MRTKQPPIGSRRPTISMLPVILAAIGVNITWAAFLWVIIFD